VTLAQYLYDKCFDKRLQVYYGTNNNEQDIIAEIYLAKSRGEMIYWRPRDRFWGYELANGTRFLFKRREK